MVPKRTFLLIRKEQELHFSYQNSIKKQEASREDDLPKQSVGCRCFTFLSTQRNTFFRNLFLVYMCVRTDYKLNLYPLLGIFKQTMIHKKLGMDKDYLATKAIPFLFPLAVEPGLNLSQVTVLTYLQDTKILSNTALIIGSLWQNATGKVTSCNCWKAREKP